MAAFAGTIPSKITLLKRYFKKADVLLTICNHRTIDSDVMASCMGLFANKKHNYTWNNVRGDALIARSRSRAATLLLKRTEDCILFIDDDVRFKEEDVTKIVDHVMDGKLICGGMYVQKGTLDKTLVLESGDTITFGKDAMVQKAVAVSSGFMCIHRSVFETLAKAKNKVGDPLMPLCHAGTAWEFFPFFNPEPVKMEDGSYIYASEDWNLCLKARGQGIQTWVDPSIFLSHVGEYSYDLRDIKREKKLSWEDFKPLTLT